VDPTNLAEHYVDIVKKVSKKAENSLRKAKECMKRQWDKSKKDPEGYEVRDEVLVSSKHLPSMWLSKKLNDKWRGPFKILGRRGPSTCEPELPLGWKGYRVFNEGRLKRFQPPSFPSQQHSPN
jgi:hypothetical protein